MQFSGKNILITGAASGIGFETAHQILQSGGQVAMLDIDAAALEKARSQLASYRERVFCATADSADMATMSAAVTQAVDTFGALHGVVANAGVRMKSVPFTELNEDTWDHIIRINLRGVFITLKACAPSLVKAGGGSMVTVSSLSGQLARLDQSAYCASKAGAIQLSRALALELAERQVRVNVVSPGTVRTAMFQQALSQDGDKIEHDRIYGSTTRFRTGIPLRKIAEADDVTQTILFFLSDASKHITGQTMFIDGGESLT